ncbi:TolC family protein [uncultured Bacteroides sp.]|uniref:TolC family protein n=1 Tax=uncultured Bacteroides sp. TaxID=162156 RepID=UPI00260C871E|nr:TolC family protein [uncultured Bacteroides sp.]
MKLKTLSIGILLGCTLQIQAVTIAGTAEQDSTHRRGITLKEAIFLARLQSVDAAVALNELKTAYWEYRTFRADLLPEINFNATLPIYNKSYSAYQQENGSYTYVRNNMLEMNGSLSIDQNIWLTGGTLSLTTSLDYIQQLDNSKDKQFMSVPVVLQLNQPIFGTNNIRWKRRIEPVRYKEAKAAFLSATEEVTMTTINYFFNLLLAKENVNIARQNLENAGKLYEVALAKRRMGQISENDVLQLRLNVLNAQSTLTGNESSLKSHMFTLRSFLALNETDELEPILSDSIPQIQLNYQEVLDKALQNNSFAHNIRRRQLEADYEVAKAKGNLREITLFAQVGLTGTDRDFHSSYSRLKDNQIVQVGMKIPILDWGKRRGQVKVAESNRKVTESRLRQESMNFNQNLFVLTEQFNNQYMQLKIADEADRIAQKRYHTNVETFMVGKISTLDLNDAQVSKDEARRKHIQELFYYWYYYYQLRSLTLWDFALNTNIDADFEALIKE